MKRGGVFGPLRSFASLGAVIVLAGCAIKPVPDDVTGVTTYNIVRQIRCETRAAARERVLTYIRELAEGSPYYPGDPKIKTLVARFDDGGEDISGFSPNLLAGPVNKLRRDYLNLIYSTAIAYSFDLTGDEQNNIGSTVDLLGPWANKLTLGVTADANRERQNERVFTLTDTLGNLLTNLGTPQFGVPYCGQEQMVGPNYVYPVAGRIGVDDTLKTFFQINVFANLTATDAAKAGNAALTAPAFTDKLTFTTTLDFTGTPKVTFAPLKSPFQVMDASVTGGVKRIDTHKVFVALALEPPGTVSSTELHGYLFPGVNPALAKAGTKKSLTFVGGSVIARTHTLAQDIAVNAVDQMKNREVQFIPTR